MAANPSYFPHYLPPGDVIQTHAKPAGLGYFADFDPKAARIEVTPTNTSAPVGSQQVVIATVSDADGQARRKRRVEWILEGPGSIVEVDEAGVTPGRGYLVSNQRAVSYTGHKAHTFDRGTDTPADDFCVEPGQTWCIITAARPGETTLTAYVPAIHNADNRLAIARISWGGGGAVGKPPTPSLARADDLPDGPARDEYTPISRPRSPEDASANTGSGADLTLDVRAPHAAKPGSEFTAMLELANVGRLPSPRSTIGLNLPVGAEVLAADPPPTERQADRWTWAADPVPGAGVRLVKLTVRPQRNGPLVLRADATTADGAKADQTATVQIGSPQLTVTPRPPIESEGGRVRVPITVANSARTAANRVILWATLPPGLTHESGRNLVELDVGTIPAEGERTVDLVLQMREPGPARVMLNVQSAAEGAATGEFTLTGRSEAAAEPPHAEPGRPALALEWSKVPATLDRNKPTRVQVVLVNRGTGPAERVEVTVAGIGVRAVRGTGPQNRSARVVGARLNFVAVDRLPAGSRAIFEVELIGDTPGPGQIEAVAAGPNTPVPVREELNVRVVGP